MFNELRSQCTSPLGLQSYCAHWPISLRRSGVKFVHQSWLLSSRCRWIRQWWRTDVAPTAAACARQEDMDVAVGAVDVA